MHIHLYIICGLEILLPVLALIVLSRFHKFRFTAVVAGIAGYFLVTNILIPLFAMMLGAIGMNDVFWAAHEFGSNILNLVLNAIFHDIALYLLLKLTLMKKKARIYDAMALGISYWISDGVQYAISNATYARVAQLSAAGKLSSMITENVTLDQLQSAANDVNALGALPFYTQLLAMAAMMSFSVALCLFFYLGIKRKNVLYLLICMGIHAVSLIIISIPALFYKDALTPVTDLIALIAGCIVTWRFLCWYRAKQQALRYRKAMYKESLKSSAASAVSDAQSTVSEDN